MNRAPARRNESGQSSDGAPQTLGFVGERVYMRVLPSPPTQNIVFSPGPK